jgi:uncharacterized protein YecE (DUF72 family)
MPRHQQFTPSIRIGCSGWQYRHWRGDFYPSDLSQIAWLEYYAGRFDTVEINNSFYRLPDATTFAAWHRRVPPHFLFSVKASRYLTHMKKLKDPDDRGVRRSLRGLDHCQVRSIVLSVFRRQRICTRLPTP